MSTKPREFYNVDIGKMVRYVPEKDFDKLKAAYDELVAALRFYADPKRYDATEIVDGVEVLEICGDQGDTAREVLEKHGVKI